MIRFKNCYVDILQKNNMCFSKIVKVKKGKIYPLLNACLIPGLDSRSVSKIIRIVDKI